MISTGGVTFPLADRASIKVPKVQFLGLGLWSSATVRGALFLLEPQSESQSHPYSIQSLAPYHELIKVLAVIEPLNNYALTLGCSAKLCSRLGINYVKFLKLGLSDVADWSVSHVLCSSYRIRGVGFKPFAASDKRGSYIVTT